MNTVYHILLRCSNKALAMIRLPATLKALCVKELSVFECTVAVGLIHVNTEICFVEAAY